MIEWSTSVGWRNIWVRLSVQVNEIRSILGKVVIDMISSAYIDLFGNGVLYL